MKILAIDTSCDDTSVAVVESKNKQINIISNIVSSQIKIHSPYGGVYPMLAKRAHQENLIPTLTQSLKKASLLKNAFILADRQERLQKNRENKTDVLNKILERDLILLEKTTKFLVKYKKPEIDAIAITNGPGLEPCLWQGVNFAKALSFWWDLPIIPVNHIKAHLVANFVSKNPKKQETPKESKLPTGQARNKQIQNSKFKIQNLWPAIGLVASGGHTELVLMQQPNKYKLIGATRDDAAGECFDKTARILGLGYPGGPVIAAEAAKKESGIKNQELRITLPRPMIKSNDFDFSFSGLKTAVLYDFQKREKKIRQSQNYKIAMAKEIQQAIIDVLIEKTFKAIKQFNAKSIILGGGVASNQNLRQQFKAQSAKCKVNFLVPSKNLCLDNAAMVGACALLDSPKSISWQRVKVNGNLNIC